MEYDNIPALSPRLAMVANLLADGDVVCDVGCDHGYLPINLVATDKYHRGVAMDINKGPLDKAASNIARYGLSDRIAVRVSDGVCALGIGEADAISICGMGGNVMMHIFSNGQDVLRSADKIVLQPQSEYMALRHHILLEGYEVDDEDIALEGDKYYFAWRLRLHNHAATDLDCDPPVTSYYYSKRLLETGSKTYVDYLSRCNVLLDKAIDSIKRNSHDNDRMRQLIKERSILEEVLG